MKPEASAKAGEMILRLDILDRIAAYSHYFDARDASSWAQLFAEDGIWESRHISANGSVSAYARGRLAIQQWAERRYADLGTHLRFMHHQSGTLFTTLDATQATTRTQVIVTRSVQGEPPAISLTGVYHDRWQLSANEWLLAHRLLVKS